MLNIYKDEDQRHISAWKIDS